MAKYALAVGSGPVAGKEAEYNKWYDEVHVPEVCAIPGVTGATRLASHPGLPGKQPYLTIYDLETDDPMAVVGEIGRRGASGELNISPAIDTSDVQMVVYKVL